jgi:hypothetical protein
MAAPRPPFDRWPVQAYDPSFGFAWYTQPATFVTQLTVEHGTLACARFIQDHIDLVLEHRSEDVASAGGLLIVHDWRAAASYDLEARREFIERMRARPRSYSRHAVTCMAFSPMLRMVVEAGNLVLTLVTGTKGEIASDPASVIAKHRIETPRAARFPGR